MNRLAILLGLLSLAVLAALPAGAVIGISVSLDRERYLRYEPISSTLVLRNDSGNPLAFSVGNSKRTLTDAKREIIAQLLTADEYASLRVESAPVISVELERLLNRKLLMLPPERRSDIQRQLAEQPGDLKENCSLELLLWRSDEQDSVPQSLLTGAPLEALGQLAAGESRETTFVLNHLVKTGQLGHYELEVRIRHNRFPDKIFSSQRVGFDILEGNTMWERTIGLPTGNSGGAIRTRKIELKTLVATKSSLYYLLISGPNAQGRQTIYLISRLCDYILGTKPQVEVDGVNNVHVIFMSNPRFYEYRVYDCNGSNLVRRFLKSVDSIPILRYDPEYTLVRVVGGEPAAEGMDYVFTDEKRRDVMPMPNLGTTQTSPAAGAGAPAAPQQ